METLSKIFESFIDKVFIGCIVLLIGYFVNRMLEKLKYKLSILGELSKKRVEKISESCEAFSLFEERLDQILANKDFSNEIIDKVVEMKKDALEKLEKNRF